MQTVAAALKSRALHDLTFRELAAEMADLPAVHARTLWRALHRDQQRQVALPASVERWLGARGASLDVTANVVTTTHSTDRLTRKFLFSLDDGQTIETVLMGYTDRFTACVSTQAGCAMGCVFCATGQMGFMRHLRPSEIVLQVRHAQRVLRDSGGARLRNLVLMGMGEPLHNYDAVMSALEIITDARGINLGPSRVTISTVGVVPGIVRLADERQPYNLAVSLHAATEAERAALVPVSRRWPLAELMDACRYYAGSTGRRIFFEWTLIAGANDSTAHAEQLAALLIGIDAHVNLIPLNPTENFSGSATLPAAAADFQRTLRSAGLPSTVRQRRGIDVSAGCGQLRRAGE